MTVVSSRKSCTPGCPATGEDNRCTSQARFTTLRLSFDSRSKFASHNRRRHDTAIKGAADNVTKRLAPYGRRQKSNRVGEAIT